MVDNKLSKVKRVLLTIALIANNSMGFAFGHPETPDRMMKFYRLIHGESLEEEPMRAPIPMPHRGSVKPVAVC